jgi:hypothetical protein
MKVGAQRSARSAHNRRADTDRTRSPDSQAINRSMPAAAASPNSALLDQGAGFAGAGGRCSRLTLPPARSRGPPRLTSRKRRRVADVVAGLDEACLAGGGPEAPPDHLPPVDGLARAIASRGWTPYSIAPTSWRTSAFVLYPHMDAGGRARPDAPEVRLYADLRGRRRARIA